MRSSKQVNRDIQEWERPDAARRQSGDFFRLMVEGLEDYAIFMLDLDGHVVSWNAGAERIMGYRAEEITGAHFSRFYTEEAVEQGWPEHELAVAKVEGRFEDEGWRVRKDGSRFWSKGVMTCLRGVGGDARGFAKIMQDRTDAKCAEDARTDALAYAENIVETVREPLLVLDGDLRVKTANRSFYRTFHVVPEETENRLVYELGSRQWDSLRLRTLLEEILPLNTSFHDFEVDQIFPGIGRKIMLLNARRICREDNHTELILLAIEDITERKQAEEERRELETRFTFLVKNIKDHAIFTLDLEGRITSWNIEAERILGYREAEAIGQHFSIIYRPDDVRQGQPDRALRTAREFGRAEDEGWHLRRNGEPFWALGIMTLTHDAGGHLTGYSKILRDMTDRKHLEEQLQQRLTELAQADRLKDEFLAMLAHELRNPLAPIRNGLHILKQPGASGGVIEQVRAMMERQAQQMARLLDDLLDVARISRGKIELHKEAVELLPLVNRTIEAVRPLAEGRRHKLTVSLPTEALWVEVDPTRLEQIVTNLLNNACKYTDPGGHVLLSAQRDRDEVVLRVRDTGIGIAPDTLPYIFDLFVQVDRRLDRSQGGMGIGLTLVKRLVELHGGTVAVRSEGLGKGSEFTVCLPVLPGQRTGCGEKPTGTGAVCAPVPSRRVLVVDDNQDAADSLALLLRLDGQDVRVAYDGPSALTVAREFRPAMAFIDIGMPGMDGYEMARKMRQQPATEKTVLVASTGWGQAEDRRRSQEAGFDYHLVKPIEPVALQQLFAYPLAASTE